MMAMLSSAPRLKKAIKDRVKRSRQRQAKRFALALRSSEKIVLYLSLDEFPDRTVPNELSALAGDRFEIRFVEGNLRPYKKLLYALTDFPGQRSSPSTTIISIPPIALFGCRRRGHSSLACTSATAKAQPS